MENFIFLEREYYNALVTEKLLSLIQRKNYDYCFIDNSPLKDIKDLWLSAANPRTVKLHAQISRQIREKT
jgi:hypothetical protein